MINFDIHNATKIVPHVREFKTFTVLDLEVHTAAHGIVTIKIFCYETRERKYHVNNPELPWELHKALGQALYNRNPNTNQKVAYVKPE